jgi:hypothetical protein
MLSRQREALPMIFGRRTGGFQAQLAERAALFGNPATSLGGPWALRPHLSMGLPFRSAPRRRCACTTLTMAGKEEVVKG